MPQQSQVKLAGNSLSELKLQSLREMSLTEPQREDDCTPKLQEESTSCIAKEEQETASSSEKGKYSNWRGYI